MELQPVKRYNDPAYPTRRAVDAQPALLRRLPQRWQRNAAILGTMTSILGLGLSSHLCAQGEDIPQLAGKMGPREPLNRYLLTEEEAAVIINQEMKVVGLAPVAETFQLKSLPVMVTRGEGDAAVLKAVPVTLTLDQYVENKRIGVEYLTQDDVAALEKQFPEIQTTTQSSPALTGSALQLAINGGIVVEAKPKPHVKVFPAIEADDKATAQALLRTQVQEFLQYLKAEGVI